MFALFRCLDHEIRADATKTWPSRSFADASRVPPLMATILLVCFGNAIGDWKMQMGIEKSTRLSSWLIAGPWSCKNDSSCGAWSLDSRIWWRNHARPHYVAKLNSFLTWRSMISLPNTLRRNLYSMGKEIQIQFTTNPPPIDFLARRTLFSSERRSR